MKLISFKDRAQAKQLQYKNELGLKESGNILIKKKKKNIEIEHILSSKDASNGANFYCYQDTQEWADLQNWASQDKSTIDFSGIGLANMLRSEHIAYNIFYPLEKLRVQQPEKLTKLLGNILDVGVDEVTDIRVEYAGDVDQSVLLDDNTSFDAYIAFVSEGKKCAVGIEIKYTEISYPHGKKEKHNLDYIHSPYWQTARASGIYELNNKNCLLLTSKSLKQPFRNHLLGLKMVQEGLVDCFYSLHLFHEENIYQREEVAIEYHKIIKDKFKKHFIMLTFEDLVAILEGDVAEDWVPYFKRRYCKD